MSAFFQLEEAVPAYMFTEAKKINTFENWLKDPTDIDFSIIEKREWNKLPANQQTFDTYYNSMSESYGRLQILVHMRWSSPNSYAYAPWLPSGISRAPNVFF